LIFNKKYDIIIIEKIIKGSKDILFDLITAHEQDMIVDYI